VITLSVLKNNKKMIFFYSGKKHGPYGGVGGFYFDAQPPNENCYLGWISGNIIGTFFKESEKYEKT
jgi:hypothetical protein